MRNKSGVSVSPSLGYIDWSKIPVEYDYAAISHSGKVICTYDEMECSKGFWDSTNSRDIVDWVRGEENLVELPLGVDWRLTQEKRP